MLPSSPSFANTPLIFRAVGTHVSVVHCLWDLVTSSGEVAVVVVSVLCALTATAYSFFPPAYTCFSYFVIRSAILEVF